jgi:hypothetical protein
MRRACCRRHAAALCHERRASFRHRDARKEREGDSGAKYAICRRVRRSAVTLPSCRHFSPPFPMIVFRRRLPAPRFAIATQMPRQTPLSSAVTDDTAWRQCLNAATLALPRHVEKQQLLPRQRNSRRYREPVHARSYEE